VNELPQGLFHGRRCERCSKGSLDDTGLDSIEEFAGLIGRHQPDDLIDTRRTRARVGKARLLQPDHLPNFEFVRHRSISFVARHFMQPG
jgi:hypothetical protein